MSESRPTAATMVAIHVGMRLRLRRLSLGMTPEDFARAARRDVAIVEGWERGEIQITAAELFDLARFLELPMVYFYDGLEDGSLTGPAVPSGSLAEQLAARSGAIKEAEGRRLLDFYYDELSTNLKRQLIDVARVFAEGEISRRQVGQMAIRAPRACNGS